MQTDTISFLRLLKNDEFEISLIQFQDNDIFFQFAPSLDVIGYGKNDVEAENSFGIALEEFLKYTKENNTLEKNLIELGWKYDEINDKLIPPKDSELINSNSSYKDILNDKAYTKNRIKISF